MAGDRHSELESYAELVGMLRELESKLTSAISTGVALVNQSIAALTTAHHQAVLEQERRNATFAERARVEELTTRVHDIRGQVSGLEGRVRDVEDWEDVALERINAVADGTNRQFVKLLSGASGYLVTALLMGSMCVLGYVLAHLH